MKTVRQLIEELQAIDGDLEVVVFGQGGSEGCPVTPEVVVGELSILLLQPRRTVATIHGKD